MNKNVFTYTIGVFVALTVMSCIKDVDFDEAENIAITPVIDLDLISFTVDADSFFDATTETPRLTISDTTEIRFLDDTGTQESLIRIDFLFRFTNSIPRSFEVDLDFLNLSSEITYSTQLEVLEGSTENPVITPDIIETVEGDGIVQLTQADRVAISITIPSADASLDGVLNLQSSATYFLEIKERE